MLGSTGKKLGQAIPGVGGESQDQSQSNEPQEAAGNLAAGVVGKTGEIVDDTGKTVGKITEGEPGDLVGNVVTATGDIVGKDGGLVGKALPLGESGEVQKEGEGGGFSIMGAASGVKGVVDTADGTLQTVNRSLPIVGDITKSLGLGGDKSEGGGGSSLLGGLLGSKPEDRDPKEKEQATEAAKKELLEQQAEKTDQDAPINLQDTEAQAQTEVESRSQPPQSETDSKAEDTEQSEAAEGGKLDEINQDDARINDDDETVKGNPAEKTLPDDVKAEDIAKGNVPEAAQDAADQTQSKAGDVAEQAEEVAEDAKSKVGEAGDEAQSKAGDAADEAQSKAGDATDQAEEGAEDAKSKAGEVGDEAQSKVGDAADEAQSKADDAADQAGSKAGDAANASVLDEIETVQVPGDVLPAPFERFEGAHIDDEGKVIYEEGSIGKVVEGNPEDLVDHDIGPDGVIRSEGGGELGRVELKSEIAEELKDELLGELKGCKVNAGGNLVNDKGEVIGRIKEGNVKQLIGRTCDDKGQIWNDSGAVIGHAELVPENEREELKDPGPFESFPDAVVQSNGDITSDGEVIGKLKEGDPKKLRNMKVSEDGSIVDRQGNQIGFAERWEPDEPEPEPEVDMSILAGKRITKMGYAVDSHGTMFGRLIEGDAKQLAGRMCNGKGEVMSEDGSKVVGRVELIPESEREGGEDGPFAGFEDLKVARDGTVKTPAGDIVGRLIEGDAKALLGMAVDEDGDILSKTGMKKGKAERWEPEPEPEKPEGPLRGLKVNKKGEVYDAMGELRAKLTSGDLHACAGCTIDDDNDVVNSKGELVGHVSLIEDIPDEEPQETDEQRKEREKAEKEKEQAEKDEKLAQSLGGCIEQGLDKIRPICKMITEKIETAERKPKDELDEEQLVKEVKPLIEEGSAILNEMNGTIRALDPDGRIQRNAKHKSGTRDATPAEYHLADVLKELTGTVTTCIDNAKKKIADMPHAKKELNPLWGLLTEPLGQILAAVGLLLAGVLNLVGRLLGGLGLGGIVDGLLGTLGLNRVLEGLGLGSVTSALTGKSKK